MAKFLPQNTWWKATSTTRPSITEITFTKSLPEGNITETATPSIFLSLTNTIRILINKKHPLQIEFVIQFIKIVAKFVEYCIIRL